MWVCKFTHPHHLISLPEHCKELSRSCQPCKDKIFFVGSYDREAWLRTTEKGAVCSSLPFDLTKPMSSLHNRTCSLSDECAGNCEYDRMHIKLNYCGVEVLYPVCSACRYAHLLPWTFLHKWGDDRWLLSSLPWLRSRPNLPKPTVFHCLAGKHRGISGCLCDTSAWGEWYRPIRSER